MQAWLNLFMKKYTLLSCFCLALSLTGFANDIIVQQSEPAIDKKQDTIEFTMRWSFNGDCGNYCYKFIGTDTIVKINGKPINSNCDHLFVKCPSNFRLHQDSAYTFIAIPFTPNDCSTIIDTCTDSKTYLLVTAIE